ncbi:MULTISPECIES: MmgE/PrpD family protein [Auritidibacter]|uniref:MmgE/PrpD family protein n=1 Tax=Auritidibacter TaxID=1160973 RepID=UPI000D73656B|nr:MULTISPECIES: MmgE/PrpD family protein [Auritidibacter]NIH71059.1 2-methylcitrate dehydratase [Auritidibacter ignavus]PXA79224.1 2-methylcitrate dehydratase [Auritidibacter sp. NML120636]RMX23005.1 MmgE/PrpD family protein [Auritidibacter ignavus]WGH83114.1 MmgE/PrpD family protein [Auritidibacter ignavus]WGH85789.1 MmgE/PrpD family protein [Auritidibacter ignavus]
MTEIQDLAEFVVAADSATMSEHAVKQLKIRVMDTIAVAIGALNAEPLVAIRELVDEQGGSEQATLIGGGRTTAEKAAFYNSALSRYLDFMDAYLAPKETNHPSDNMGAVLAAAELAGASGKTFLDAFAVAIQVHTRLSDVAPVRDRGFDHTTQGSYAAAAGVAKALGLTADQAAHAMAIAGTANNALRVTRTGDLSHWKGLAYAHVAQAATWAALLAQRGITGPAEVFEGNKGFKDSIAGDFQISWSAEDLEKVTETIIKKHNAEIHSQSALEAAQDMRAQHDFDPTAIASVKLKTFDVAWNIIGGGEEGDKRTIRTKEEADHSLPWMLACVLLDGELTPAQYSPERIVADDVQSLMTKVEIAEDPEFSAQFPQHMPAELTVTLQDGTVLNAEKRSYPGFHDDPMNWQDERAKFDALVSPFTTEDWRDHMVEVIYDLDNRPIADLTELLAQVNR